MSQNSRSGARTPYSVSQNFFTSRCTIERLVKLSGIGENDYVIEIGPGKGHITRALAARAETVRAIEIDPKLYVRLCELLGDKSNISLINRDFMSTALPKQRYKAFSNIPFSRTSEIVQNTALGPY